MNKIVIVLLAVVVAVVIAALTTEEKNIVMSFVAASFIEDENQINDDSVAVLADMVYQTKRYALFFYKLSDTC